MRDTREGPQNTSGPTNGSRSCTASDSHIFRMLHITYFLHIKLHCWGALPRMLGSSLCQSTAYFFFRDNWRSLPVCLLYIGVLCGGPFRNVQREAKANISFFTAACPLFGSFHILFWCQRQRLVFPFTRPRPACAAAGRAPGAGVRQHQRGSPELLSSGAQRTSLLGFHFDRHTHTHTPMSLVFLELP